MESDFSGEYVFYVCMHYYMTTFYPSIQPPHLNLGTQDQILLLE